MVVIRKKTIKNKSQLELGIKVSAVGQNILKVKKLFWEARYTIVHYVFRNYMFLLNMFLGLLAIIYSAIITFRKSSSVVILFDGLYKLGLYDLCLVQEQNILWVTLGIVLGEIIVTIVALKLVNKTHSRLSIIFSVLSLLINITWIKIIVSKTWAL